MVTAEHVSKYFPQSKETIKGHMNHKQQGGRSNKLKKASLESQEVDAS
jgi:hypothetical protein